MDFQRTQLGVEAEVLLCCARTHTDAKTSDRLGLLLKQELDWDSIIRTALTHGVLPFLYSNLRQNQHAAVLKPVWDQLHTHFRANVQNSFFLTAELLKLLKLFDKHGIAAIPFKGPVLAASAYRDVTLRQFTDLDVLIHRKDLERTKSLLLAQGYQLWRPLTQLEEAAHLRVAHAYTLVRTDGRVSIDLHWRIAQEQYSFGLDPESLWHRMALVSLGGVLVPTLHAADLLMVLCIHGAKHGWERLAWICDIAEVVRSNPQLRWDEIINRSAALQITRAVLLGLDLAKSLLDAPIPEQVLSVIQNDHRIRQLSRFIQNRLFARTRKFGPLERTAIFFVTREHLRNRLPHIAHSVHRAVTPNEADTSLFYVPRYLSFVYYFIRPLRLVGKYGRMALKSDTKES